MNLSVAQATEIAAFVAAGASLVSVLAQYRLTRQHELTKWQREYLLPTLARSLAMSRENRDQLIQRASSIDRTLLDSNLKAMRRLSAEVALLSPGLSDNVSLLVNTNASAVKSAVKSAGVPDATRDSVAVIITAEKIVTKTAHTELGLRPSWRRKLVLDSLAVPGILRMAPPLIRSNRRNARSVGSSSDGDDRAPEVPGISGPPDPPGIRE